MNLDFSNFFTFENFRLCGTIALLPHMWTCELHSQWIIAWSLWFWYPEKLVGVSVVVDLGHISLNNFKFMHHRPSKIGREIGWAVLYNIVCFKFFTIRSWFGWCWRVKRTTAHYRCFPGCFQEKAKHRIIMHGKKWMVPRWLNAGVFIGQVIEI